MTPPDVLFLDSHWSVVGRPLIPGVTWSDVPRCSRVVGVLESLLRKGSVRNSSVETDSRKKINFLLNYYFIEYNQL